MPQIPYRGNLQSLAFPLLSSLSGRTVIDQGSDQTYYPQVSTDGGVPIDRGIPQAIYAHNVMPSTFGWQSVGYKDAFLEPDEEAWGFEEVHFVRGAKVQPIESEEDEEEEEEDEDDPEEPEEPETEVVSQDLRTYLSIANTPSGWKVFKVGQGVSKWSPVANGAPELASNSYITTADLNGVTYIFFSRQGCYVYDIALDTLIPRELKSIEYEEQLGILGSNGYMLLYNEDSVAWSSSVDVEDFEPSDISGAGGGSVQEAMGRIITAVPTFLGFLLYTEGNVVSVTFSGNESFPWNFKGIPSSGGLGNKNMVSIKDSNGYQFAYTTNGLQKISHQKAETIFPSITDFLSGQVIEDFDWDTNELTEINLTYPMRKGVSLISDRYLVLSYGRAQQEPFTHAVIVDISQSRYGKLRYPHESVFERFNIDPGNTEVAKESICLIQDEGMCRVVDFSPDAVQWDSVLILGKFQVTRQAMTQIQELEVENIRSEDFNQILGLPSMDGKTLTGPVVHGYLADNLATSRRVLFPSLVGKNVSFIIKGKFNIISFVIWFTLHGRF